MEIRPGATWTALAGALVLPLTIAVVMPAQGVAQTRGKTSSSSQTTRQARTAQSSARPTQPTTAAQRAPAKAPVAEDVKPSSGWTKKTPDGQPDLQGFWSTSSSVPMERPASCGAREFYTEEEMKAGGRNCISETPPTDAQTAETPRGGRGARGGG